ncbi:hypothetical protein [Streptomyces sp. SP2-10]|uniref:hypothetical protein n=1 Tax=Streptomyces sp. SP2-10 TaxID=2873385 RepID=UPI001CA64400|nr:hypothetical protein [Streptomyces sp. SP2-10]MBY8846647.1 hypothetical protein [Streptomyces sp. SP2-10]
MQQRSLGAVLDHGASIEDVLFPRSDVRLEGVSVTAALLLVDAVASDDRRDTRAAYGGDAGCTRPITVSCPNAPWGQKLVLNSARDRRPEQLDVFKPFLRQQYAAGITNGRTLFQQIRERGFRGGYSTLTPYRRTLKAGTTPAAPAEIPSPRRVTSWIMRPCGRLSTQEVEHLDQAQPGVPRHRAGLRPRPGFYDLVRNRRGQLLPAWIRQAEQSDVLLSQTSPRSFARTSTLSPPASPANGPLEGLKAMSIA